MSKLLTIGMAVFRDFDGLWATVQGLNANHGTDYDILCVNNAPEDCVRTRSCIEAVGGKYYHRPDLVGTSASRDYVFHLAKTPWVMCIDSHIIFENGAISAALEYAKSNPNSRDIIQGPLVADNGKSVLTHWEPRLGSKGLWGEWATNPRFMKNEPFIIPMQGLGVWMMRKEVWPGFNPGFRGFGGEEGYIHEKVRRHGGLALCLPALRWRHRFRDYKTGAPPAPYPQKLEDHTYNLLVGHRELGIEAEVDIQRDFASRLPQPTYLSIRDESVVKQPFNQMVKRPEPTNLLGIWYSNNAAPELILKQSLQSIQNAVYNSRHNVHVITCSWSPIPSNPFPSILAPSNGVSGHAKILEQMRLCVSKALNDKIPFEAIVFLEQDVLYGASHFDAIGDAFQVYPQSPVVVNHNYIGLNGTGYLSVRERHDPLHQMAIRKDFALENFTRIHKDLVAGKPVHLEPCSDFVRGRVTKEGLVGTDLDGVLTQGFIPPAPNYVVISGALKSVPEDIFRAEQFSRGNPFYLREGEPNDRHGAALHKAEKIKELGVVEFFEDDPYQFNLIRSLCPGVIVRLVKAGRVNPYVGRESWIYLPPERPDPAVHINHKSRFTSHGEVVYEPVSTMAPKGKTLSRHPYWGLHKDHWPYELTEDEKKACGACSSNAKEVVIPPYPSMEAWYFATKGMPSDFNEHMDTLKSYADKCSVVAELSHWPQKPALIALAHSNASKVVSVSAKRKPEYGLLQKLRPGFHHVFEDSLVLEPKKDPNAINQYRSSSLGPVDLLFIDTQHQASRIYTELLMYHERVSKYIVVHCTSVYGEKGDDGSPGVRVGLRRFLSEHRHWTVKYATDRNFGLIVLSKLEEDKPRLPGKLDMAWNFTKAATRHIFNGRQLLPLEMAEERLKHCWLCDRRHDNRCSECGCFLDEFPDNVPGKAGDPGKVFYPTEQCPLGKWHAQKS